MRTERDFTVTFTPGGPTDIQGRMLGEKFGQRVGQQVVVDNRGGRVIFPGQSFPSTGARLQRPSRA